VAILACPGIVNGIIADPGAPAFRQSSGVIAKVIDGALSIIGTDQDDLLNVYQINSQSFLVEGIGGTTINGSTESIVFQSAQVLSVDLGRGNDTITFEGYFGKRRLGVALILNTGIGDDTITFTNFIGTELFAVSTGDGRDQVNIFGSSFYDTTMFDLGRGEDTLVLRSSGFHGDATITGGLDIDILDALMLTEFGIQDLLVEDFEIGDINLQPLMFQRKPVDVRWHRNHHAFVV